MSLLTKILMIITAVVVVSSCKKADQQPVQKTLTITQTKNKQLFWEQSPFKWAKQVGTLKNITNMQMDGNGNIIILGDEADNPQNPLYPHIVYTSYLVKVDSAGNVLWQTSIPDENRKMVLDVKGNVYCLNTSTQTGNETLFKIDGATGSVVLNKIIGGGSTTNIFAPSTDFDDLAIDGAGNIFLTGFYSHNADLDPGPGAYPTTGTGHYMLKLLADGSTAYICNGMLKNSNTNPKLQVGLDGSVVFFGSSAKNNTYHLEFEAYNSKGTYQWSKSIDLLSPATGSIRFIRSTNTDYYLYKSGEVTVQAPIYKIDKAGNIIYKANTANWIPRNSMTVDPAGNVYFTGYFTKSFYGDPNSNNPDFDPRLSVFKLPTPLGSDIYIDEYDTGGNFKGAISFHSTTTYTEDIGKFIISDKDGNLYLAGTYDDAVDFDPTEGTSILNPAAVGYASVFLVKLKP